MNSPPISKTTQALNLLKQAIARGDWKHHLPSERALSAELMISRTSIRQVLDSLTEEGIISPPEQSRRRKILKRPDIEQSSDTGRVIFLTPKPELESPTRTMIQIAELRALLSKTDQNLTVIAPNFYGHENVSHKTLSKLTDNFPDARWVLHQSPEHIQRWFNEQNLTTVILGSRFPGITLPIVDVDLKSASRHATGLLMAKGHRNIGLIRFRTHLAGDDAALDGMNEAIATSADAQLFPTPAVIGHNFHSENLASTLDKIYSAPNPPTALVVVNDHHFITAFTHLLSRGIRIPEDVSIICLADNPELKHIQPQPTYYSCGKKRFNALSKILLNPTAQTSTLCIPEIVPGRSVGPANLRV